MFNPVSKGYFSETFWFRIRVPLIFKYTFTVHSSSYKEHFSTILVNLRLVYTGSGKEVYRPLALTGRWNVHVNILNIGVRSAN
jgi:hypothetical protein